MLVNNAAITKHKQIWHLSADEVERVMAVNFLACVWTTLAALPHMLLAGSGTIVNVSSFAAEVVPPREAVYGASKAALHAFTQGLWNDLEGSNLHAALVIPGAIDTEIWDKEDEPVAYRGRKAPPQVVTRRDLRGDREAPARDHRSQTQTGPEHGARAAPVLARDAARGHAPHGPGARRGRRARARAGAPGLAARQARLK